MSQGAHSHNDIVNVIPKSNLFKGVRQLLYVPIINIF